MNNTFIDSAIKDNFNATFFPSFDVSFIVYQIHNYFPKKKVE